MGSGITTESPQERAEKREMRCMGHVYTSAKAMPRTQVDF